MMWAMIDAATGAILSHGNCAEGDLFRQALPIGAIFVVRPEHVTCFEPWRLVENTWTLGAQEHGDIECAD